MFVQNGRHIRAFERRRHPSTTAFIPQSFASGVIFTLPALLLLGAWADFHFAETALIAGYLIALLGLYLKSE